MSLNIFGSCYDVFNDYNRFIQLHQVDDPENDDSYICVHPIGFDPIWNVSFNKFEFVNKYKVKFFFIFSFFCYLLFQTIRIIESQKRNARGLLILLFNCVFYGYVLVLIISKYFVEWDLDPSIKDEYIGKLFLGIFIKQKGVIQFYQQQNKIDLMLFIFFVSSLTIIFVIIPITKLYHLR